MASWKENKMVGIIAAILFILSMVVMAVQLKPKAYPTVKATLKTPANTPYIK
jgi:hypothetical protein